MSCFALLPANLISIPESSTFRNLLMKRLDSPTYLWLISFNVRRRYDYNIKRTDSGLCALPTSPPPASLYSRDIPSTSQASKTMSRNILVIGIPLDHPLIAEYIKDVGLEVIHEGIAKSDVLLKDAGFDATFLFVGDEMDIVPLKEELSRKRYSAVVVGLGMRRNPAFSVLFEKIVNEVVETAPGIKLLFNTSPESTLDAVKRWF